MDNHILKKDLLNGYPNRDYRDKTHSIIEDITEVIFLSEDNGIEILELLL